MGRLRKNMQSKLVFLKVDSHFYIWDRVFKSGLSKFCGRQPSKKLKGCELFKPKFFTGSLPQNLLSPFLTNFSHFSCYSLMTYLMMLFVVCWLESDQPETVKWGRKWLVDFKAGKTQTCFVLPAL